MKPARVLLVFSVLLAFGALQCTSTTDPSGIPFDTLSYTREGGLIGGLVFQVDIHTIGTVAVNRPSGARLDRITAQERDSLVAITRGYAQWSDSAQTGGCVDCYSHHFSISGSEGKKSLLYDDAGLSVPSPDAGAVRRLVDVMESIVARVSPVSLD